MTEYHITDYHREIGIDYYKKLIHRFGIKRLLRYIPTLKRIIWTKTGLGIMEKYLLKEAWDRRR